jgi:type I restriction enzyme S subunit
VIEETTHHRTIGELCDFGSGHGFSAKEWASAGLPIVRIQNLNGSTDFKYFGGEPERSWIVEPGELLFAWAGVRGVSFGPTVWQGPRGVLNQHIYRIRPKAGIDKNWLHAALKVVTSRIERKAHGFKSSLVHVRKADIANARVFAPAPAEQAEIARVMCVWELAVVLTERVVAAKQERRKWLMQQLIAGGRRFPGLNDPWRATRLGDVTEESTERNRGRLDQGSVRAVNKILGMVPMKDHIIADDVARYKVVRRNWFAYNQMRINIGSICMWEGKEDVLVSPDYVVFPTREDRLDPRYLNYVRMTLLTMR